MILVWKVVMWVSESSIPVKVIFGFMKLVSITTFMTAWEKGMGQALTGMGRLFHLLRAPPSVVVLYAVPHWPYAVIRCLFVTHPNRPEIGFDWLSAMRSPISVKEVQQLTGRMAALSILVSAGGDKGHPYF